MSKRMQVYYNAVFGAIGGLFGWLLAGGIGVGDRHILATYALVGAAVGLAIGAFTGMVDGAVVKRSPRRAAIGAMMGAAAGLVSGMLGLLIGEGVFLLIGGGMVGRSMGWLLLGLFLGIGEGIISRSNKRASYGAIGGAVAGLMSGLLYEGMTQRFITSGDTVQMIVGAIGLIAIGASLGAVIPLAGDVLAGKGTLVVRSGKRQGTELTVVDAVTIGSYDGCGLYLPGDTGIAPKHARVYQQDGKLMLESLEPGRVTRLNGAPVSPGAPVELPRGAQLELGATRIELK